jgi:CRP/FNR family transcriptional regulator
MGAESSNMPKNSRLMPCSIAHDGIRSALTDGQLRRLEAASRQRSLKAGEFLFKEGDKTTHTFAVTSGTIKLSKIHPNNKGYVIALMFPGDLLCGACKPHQMCSAEAATVLELCAVPLEAYWRLFEEAGELERALFRASLSEFKACQEWMLLLRRSTAYERIAHFLLLLAKGTLSDFLPGPACLRLPLSRGEIAGLLDLTIETVSRQLSLMQKRGLIEFSGSREVIIPAQSQLMEKIGAALNERRPLPSS